MELKDIPGIGEKTIQTLARAGIQDLQGLLHTFPRTYQHFQAQSVIGLKNGDQVILQGTITRPTSHHIRRLTTQSATFWDATGSLTLRWFNMPYLVSTLKPLTTYLVKGQVTEFRGRLQIVAPSLTLLQEPTKLKDQLVPVYRSRAGVKPWIFRQKVAAVLKYLPTLPDPLPQNIRATYHLTDYFTALCNIHFPSNYADLEQAVYRLSFQELFTLQLNVLRHRLDTLQPGIPMSIPSGAVDSFLASLPFTPTASQRSAIKEIVSDLNKPFATSRLLQGEVGSGKTVVAVAAAFAAHAAGHRTVVMAPTQILALQLFENFQSLTAKLGLSVSLITARSSGDPTSNILVGTQALLGKINLGQYGLVIIDEQQRFGVLQREALARGELRPHLLQMTATPIPRSAAETLLRHLDITRLTDIPQGRLPTKTYLVPDSKRLASYRWINHEIQSRHTQVFMVVPLIELAEESDTTPLKSIKELASSLKQHFPGVAIDLMHGRMKEAEKLAHMQLFKTGATQILVATSMIEVGIDIPQANIMVIENAERFGLAQLHQLRGRVGRGGKQGHCLLFSQGMTPKARARLGYFLSTHDGAKLAEYDLKARGPGELFGTSQSGFFNLSVGNMYDERLLQDTYSAAKLVLKIDKSPKMP